MIGAISELDFEKAIAGGWLVFGRYTSDDFGGPGSSSHRNGLRDRNAVTSSHNKNNPSLHCVMIDVEVI